MCMYAHHPPTQLHTLQVTLKLMDVYTHLSLVNTLHSPFILVYLHT